MKKQFLLLLSIAAVSALAACNINVNPASSSLEPVDSSSESSSEESTSSSEESSSSAESSSSEESTSSSSSSSSSSQEDIGPVPSDIVIPNVESEQNYIADKDFSDYILLNYSSLSLVAGSAKNSTAQLRGLPRALQPASNFSFRSLDTSVATVDDNGNVAAVAQGKTSIEVADKDHPEAKLLVPVSVFGNLVPAVPEVEGVHYTQAEIDAAQPGDDAYGKTVNDWKVEPADEIPNDKEKIAQITDQLATIDESNLTEIVDHELREMSTYKNGKRQFYNVWDETLVASKDEAYFRITETDGDTKVEDGAMTFEDSEWIFSTNQYYDTYVFHTLHGTKNYFPISTVDYIPEDPSVNNRYAPLYDVLDNLFTIGHEIFTDTLENATMADCIDIASKDYTNVVKNCVGGFLGQDGNPSSTTDLFFDCVLEFPNEKADLDTERNYGIPYGTPMPATQRMIYTIKDGKLVHYRLELIQDYSFGGDNYQKIYYIDHNYERITDANRDQLLIIPDVKGYNLVDYLFAI